MSESLYVQRYAWQKPLFPEYEPDKDLGLIIVIPAYKEEELLNAIHSLSNAETPRSKVLILVIVNESEQADEHTRQINQESTRSLADCDCPFDMLYDTVILPEKKAGVGLARKIGMDEAVRIFQKAQSDGIIVCYDADCVCQDNYLVAIEQTFTKTSVGAGIVFYEHQLNGSNHEAILNYELYLRYYINALRFAGFPYAHQTLGSCIVVRSSIYQKYGGMNTRKAGEDFYFLNKVIPHGGFEEINTTTIFPSDRVSDRVPFGTGRAVGELLESNTTYTVYNPLTFQDLQYFFDQVEKIWDQNVGAIPISIQKFLGSSYLEEIDKSRKQTASLKTFKKRFYHWFDAFKILKYVHFCRDHMYPNVPLREALDWLNQNYVDKPSNDLKHQLIVLRRFDRIGPRLNRKDF